MGEVAEVGQTAGVGEMARVGETAGVGETVGVGEMAGVGETAVWRRLTAEFAGSAFLAAAVIGSGIAAASLSPGDTGLELLENAAATAAGLAAIILMFGPVSGGHFNPVVSFADAVLGGLRWRDAAAYLPAQVAGCVAGAVAANVMFARAAVTISVKERATGPHFVAEIIATLGLIMVIFALARSGRSRTSPAAVGAYIGAAYFFTSSTSFANPAITVGRMFSDTFAGIAPAAAPAFIAAQVIGGGLAVALIKMLYPGVSHEQAESLLALPAGPPVPAPSGPPVPGVTTSPGTVRAQAAGPVPGRAGDVAF